MADVSSEVARLKGIRTAIATGDMVQSARFKDSEVSYYSANLDLLDRLILDMEAQLATASGTPPVRMVIFSTSKGI